MIYPRKLGRMDESFLTEKAEVELKEDEDNQGGIRRRLRDRDLLKKRKAELEEKETYQWVSGLESRRKRARREKSSSGKKGRPRKTDEPPLQLPVLQEEPGQLPPEAPAVVVVPEPTLVIPSAALMPVFPDPLESQPGNVPAGPAPIPLPASSNNDAGPALTPAMPVPAPLPAPVAASVSPVASIPGLVSASAQETSPATLSAPFFMPTSDSISTSVPSKVSFSGLTDDRALDAGPVSAPPPAPTDVSSLVSAKAPVPDLPSLAEVVTTESQDKGALDEDQVLIEDLGPDEKEDISFPLDKRVIDQDTSQEPLLSSRPDENGTFSSLPLISPTAPPEYRPAYQF